MTEVLLRPIFPYPRSQRVVVQHEVLGVTSGELHEYAGPVRYAGAVDPGFGSGVRQRAELLCAWGWANDAGRQCVLRLATCLQRGATYLSCAQSSRSARRLERS